jgi:hypothetical protein
MATPEQMLREVQLKGRSLDSFQKGDTIQVNNKMKDLKYKLKESKLYKLEKLR